MKARSAHFVLLAALLAGFAAHAATVHVTFDDSLTNRTDETKWEYRGGFEYVSSRNAFAFTKKLGKGDDQVISQLFDFAITSVVLRAEKGSASTTRNLMYRAMSGESDQSAKELVVDIVPTDQVVFTSRWKWAQSDRVRSLALLTTSGSGYIYLSSADISGCYICPQPQNVEAGNVQGTRFTLSWENGEGVVSNRVDVLEVKSVPEQGGIVDTYDFAAIVGYKTSAKELTGDDYANFPCFTNSENLFAADGTNGILQISSTTKHGVLVYEGPGTVDETTLFLSARKHPKDNASTRTISIGWTEGGSATNSFPDVEIDNVFKTVRIPLTNMTDSVRLVMKPASSQGDQRIQIDEMTFVRDYAEAYVATNALPPMATDQNRLRIRRLAPKTLYIATVTAFDDEGNPSEPSAPVEVETRSYDPDAVLFLR